MLALLHRHRHVGHHFSAAVGFRELGGVKPVCQALAFNLEGTIADRGDASGRVENVSAFALALLPPDAAHRRLRQRALHLQRVAAGKVRQLLRARGAVHRIDHLRDAAVEHHLLVRDKVLSVIA